MPKSEEVRVWLDDWRDEPDGWYRTYSVEETLSAIENFNVVELSLDNDLGDGLKEGIKVLDWLEERLLVHEVLPPPLIHAHTENPAARRSMRQIIDNLVRHVHALQVQHQRESYLDQKLKDPEFRKTFEEESAKLAQEDK